MKKLVDLELLFKAEQLFDELRGEVNPERGYANELEAEILIARDQFRAALDAPQQEAVALVRYSVGALPHFVPVINGSATFDCSAVEALEYEPLYTHPAPSVPEGWQLVPKEPTTEMMAVHDDLLMQGVPRGRNLIYKAMLLAAPKAPTTDDRKDAERYQWLCNHRNVLLLTGFFGNGCINRTIEEVHAAIDAAIAAQKGEKE